MISTQFNLDPKKLKRITTINQICKSSVLLFLSISVGLGLSTTAFALNWDDNYGAGISAGYDDNFFLAPSGDELDTTFSSLNLVGGLVGESETTKVLFQAGIESFIYSESSIDDRTDSSLSFSLANQNSDRSLLGLDLSHQQESSIETELLDSGVIADGTRDRLEITPSFQYLVDDRNVFSVELSFVDVSYDTVPLEEYQDNAITIGWGYQLDERSTITANLLQSRLEPEETDETDTTVLYLDYEMKESESITYNFLFGKTDVDGPEGSEDGSSYGIIANHVRDEFNNFIFSASRSYVPSGLGFIREEDRINFDWLHGFSEQLQGSFLTAFVGTDDRDYIELRPGLLYRLSEELVVSGYYRYRRQDGTGIDADSNSLFFSLSYSN